MRLVFLFILASLFGYSLLQFDKIDPNNYVKMYIAGYSIEIKVLGFLLLLIAIVVTLYFSLWLIRTLWSSPKRYNRWRNHKNHELAEQQLGAGYLSLIKGDWHRAESQLLSNPDHSGIPYVNYLAAAQAAQQQGKLEKRDDYLSKAYQAAPQERLAIGLTKANLHQQAGQLEQALATLEDVEEIGKKNAQFTAMMLQTHEQMNDWQQALALLPQARKQKALPDDVLEDIEAQVFLYSIKNASNVEKAWQELPRAQRKQIANIELYTRRLVDNGNVAQAEKIIRSALKNDWSDDLVTTYGKLQSEKPLKLLRKVEGWLMARPENAHLNLAAARLAVAGGQKDQAKGFLQKAISTAQLPEAYSLLGELLEAEDENSKALQLYRSGVKALSLRSTLPSS